jgi:hypothetical protein
VLCAAVGLLLAVLPHIATMAKYGTARYLADGDDVLYLAVARIPAQGENSLRDPFSRPSENTPSLYAWLQFVPLAKLSTALGIPPILMNLLWRIVGGLLFGAALFILFRTIFRGLPSAPWWALGCALICLADAGFADGRMLVANLTLLNNLRHGTTPLLKADALPQYRIVTPLLNLPIFLLLGACLIARLGRLRKGPEAAGSATEGGQPPVRSVFRRGWLLAAAGSLLLGLCFHLYFFFWTAAVVGIGAFVAWNLFWAWRDPACRTAALARAKLCGLVLAGGLVLGAPQVYGNAKTFAVSQYQPILQRLSRGRDVGTDPEARFRFLRNYWLWLKLGIGAAGILLFRFRRLALIWFLTAAGYALACSALITKLEFENFHWSYVHAAFGEILVLGVAAQFLAPRLRNWGRLRFALWLIPAGLLVTAAAWRPYEAIKAPEAAWNSRVLGELQPLEGPLAALGPDCVLAGPKETDLALLFSRCGQLYQQPYTAHNSVITDEEVNERHALNAWLQGKTPAEYLVSAREEPLQVGPSPNPAWQPETVAFERSKIFTRVSADATPFLVRYRPTALILRAGATPPSGSGEWRLVQNSEKWNLWARP